MNACTMQNAATVKYPLAHRASPLAAHRVVIEGVDFHEFVSIAGPCAIETPEVILQAAHELSRLGIRALRGGCWKPRTSPYDFQGHGADAVKWAINACRESGVRIFVTEVVSVEADQAIDRALDELGAHNDLTIVRQVGTRNAQNFELLKHLGTRPNPVLLKRGMGNTLEEFVCAAEYLLAGGNQDVALCLRGHRLDDAQDMRFALDYEDIPQLQAMTWLPIIYDPSHSTGLKQAVIPIAREAYARGANGLLVDVHPDPTQALCDAKQALLPGEFEALHHHCLSAAA